MYIFKPKESKECEENCVGRVMENSFFRVKLIPSVRVRFRLGPLGALDVSRELFPDFNLVLLCDSSMSLDLAY